MSQVEAPLNTDPFKSFHMKYAEGRKIKGEGWERRLEESNSI